MKRALDKTSGAKKNNSRGRGGARGRKGDIQKKEGKHGRMLHSL
jgi:hypothetical protein